MAAAAIAFAGTALALSGTLETRGENHATETTVKEEVTLPDEPVASEPIRDEDREDFKPPSRDVIDHEPVDDTPPWIEILFPDNGQVFEKSEVVFEGITEPGARVRVGDHEADVNDDGGWRIVLDLSPGENEFTFNAIDEAENGATASITVIYHQPEPKAEEPKEEEPKEEPKEEPPVEEVAWEFSAHQKYGECSENPPYDIFYGTGKPGSTIVIESEFGRKEVEIGEKGGWDAKVFFEGAPVGEVFAVYVVDQFDHQKVFEFVHTG